MSRSRSILIRHKTKLDIFSTIHKKLLGCSFNNGKREVEDMILGKGGKVGWVLWKSKAIGRAVVGAMERGASLQDKLGLG